MKEYRQGLETIEKGEDRSLPQKGNEKEGTASRRCDGGSAVVSITGTA